MPTFVLDLCTIVASGGSIRYAAGRVGISKSAAHRWIGRYGTDARRRLPDRIAPETIHRIQRLRGKGTSIRATAVALGISRKAVRLHSLADDPVYRCPGCGYKTHVRPCLSCSLSC